MSTSDEEDIHSSFFNNQHSAESAQEQNSNTKQTNNVQFEFEPPTDIPLDDETTLKPDGDSDSDQGAGVLTATYTMPGFINQKPAQNDPTLIKKRKTGKSWLTAPFSRRSTKGTTQSPLPDEAALDNRSKTRPPNPEPNSNFISKILMIWVFPMVWRGWKQPLDEIDMWELLEKESANACKTRFHSYYDSYPADDQKRFIRALVKSTLSLFIFTGILRLLVVAFSQIQPIFINKILEYLQDSSIPEYEGYLWGLALFLTPLLQAIVENHYYFWAMRGGMRVIAAIQGVIYDKALSLSPSARAGTSVGQIVNLMQLDSKRIGMFLTYGHGFWAAPAQLIVAMGLLFNYIGVSALIGLVMAIITVPVQGKLVAHMAKLRKLNFGISDERVKLTNEILQGIRAVKFYAWERPFAGVVNEVRERELHNYYKTILTRSIFQVILLTIPTLISVVTFAFYAGVFKKPLDPAIIFTGLALLNQLRQPLIMFPFIINSLVDSKISAKRIQKLLDAEDINTEKNSPVAIPTQDAPDKQNGLVQVRNGEFTWKAESKLVLEEPKKEKKTFLGIFPKWDRKSKKAAEAAQKTEQDKPPTTSDKKEAENDVSELRNINITCPQGKITAIIGKVGSGKSSLIQAILGEMKKLNGTITVNGRTAYVSQSAWIFNATLQENILFYEKKDVKRYEQALDVAQLGPDLEQLPAGDQTAIGEKGINLSGGQKQRVSIARAIYANADIYFFDDPLSALDAHVGKKVFDKCISEKGVLAGKTRVLVTNQLHFVPHADHIILIEKGQIVAQGTYSELYKTNDIFKNLMNASNTHDDDKNDPLGDPTVHNSALDETSVKKDKEEKKNGPQKKNTLIENEERNTGNIGWKTYVNYARAFGGVFFFAFVLFLFCLSTANQVITNWWLSYWSANYTLHGLDFYLGIYFALAISYSTLIFFRTIIFYYSSLLASRKLHVECLDSVLHAPMSFFDTTPIGRIISRFSRDINFVDQDVPMSLQQVLNTFLNLFSAYILIGIVLPLFIAVAVPIGIGYFLLQRFYNRTNIECKRLDSISKSPIYAHFSETLSGLPSIRAYNKAATFQETNLDKIDLNHRAYFAQFTTSRWFSMYLEILGSFMILSAAMFAVASRGQIYSGLIGLCLTYVLQVSSFLSFAVRSITELEAAMNAVERLNYYINDLPQEAPYSIPETEPDKNWPSKGTIKFKGVEMRYREGLSLVLKGVDCEIYPGEKIGVIGRTGAGKSSLMITLLRLVELSGGQIIVDDHDLAVLGLETVRSNITIIPQDPVMFSGTLRFNIDPFKSHSDKELWKALEKSHLKEFVSNSPDGLDLKVSEYGENLSAGQRQLICLTRALLRNPKILIMDEATSNVDFETDQLIQDTVRSEFAHCTILTIAHRLWTIADYDRILVMDKGKVGEFAPPAELLDGRPSMFSGLVDAMGEAGSKNYRALVSKNKLKSEHL